MEDDALSFIFPPIFESSCLFCIIAFSVILELSAEAVDEAFDFDDSVAFALEDELVTFELSEDELLDDLPVCFDESMVTVLVRSTTAVLTTVCVAVRCLVTVTVTFS